MIGRWKISLQRNKAVNLQNVDRATAAAKREGVAVRFAGDSGDGVQILGGEFAKSSALAGHDLFTFPDFPAEIRALMKVTAQSVFAAEKPRSSRRWERLQEESRRQ